MFQYRVTKYDPSRRDAGGAYPGEEWTSFSDIGRSFGGVVLAAAHYTAVEDAYVATAVAFWHEMGRPRLFVRGLESSRGSATTPSEGDAVEGDPELADVIRRILREEFWCRVESDRYFVHLGWDYYMYLGVSDACSKSCAFAAASGLFVEDFVSPHHCETNA
jgi:hypothetical protein